MHVMTMETWSFWLIADVFTLVTPILFPYWSLAPFLIIIESSDEQKVFNDQESA